MLVWGQAWDHYGDTPLHIATGKGQLEALRKLVALGADVEARDENGRTALHMAAFSGQVRWSEHHQRLTLGSSSGCCTIAAFGNDRLLYMFRHPTFYEKTLGCRWEQMCQGTERCLGEEVSELCATGLDFYLSPKPCGSSQQIPG